MTSAAGRSLYAFVAFQVGWFASVLGAARGNGSIGPLVVAAIVAVHVAVARDRRGEMLLLAASVPIGLAVDGALQTSGAVVAPGPATGPIWLLALWPLFATLFTDSMSWLRGRYALGVALAAVGAPLSYLAGERAGALALAERPASWIPQVVVAWAIAMASLMRVHARVTASGGAAPAAPRDQGTNEIS